MPNRSPKRANWSRLSDPPDLFDASGAFETCRVSGGRVLFLEEHLQRLRASLQTLGFSLSRENETRAALARAARGMKQGSVRIAVRRCGKPRLIVHRRPGISYADGLRSTGVVLTTVPTRWPAGDRMPAQAKGSERLSGILARLEAPDPVDLLRLGPDGTLTEGTVSNLFFVKRGILYTPPTWAGVLEGVTRHRVLEAARDLGIPGQEIPVSRHELFNAEEAFLTNVLMGILPIRSVDGRRIGTRVPGPVTRRLTQAILKERSKG